MNDYITLLNTMASLYCRRGTRPSQVSKKGKRFLFQTTMSSSSQKGCHSARNPPDTNERYLE